MVFKGISLIQSRETKAKKGANMSCFTVIHNLGQSIFYWHMCGQNMMMSDLSMDTKLGLHGANGRSCLTSLEKQVEDIPGEMGRDSAGSTETTQCCLTGKAMHLVNH